ncbi:MAG: Crp/Fnr family transcriptional regulator [Bacteroidota bacterium]
MAIDAAHYPAVRQYLNRLSPISEATWTAVAKHLHKTEFQPQEFFAKAGRYEHQTGILLDGIFRAYSLTQDSTEFTKTLYTPISFTNPISYLGAYTALVTQQVNQVNVQALTQATVLVCSYQDWLGLAETHPEVATWSQKLAHLFFIGKETRELQLSTMQAHERYLLFRSEFPELEHLISQYHIAQYLGITPTQLSRIRKKVFGH